MSLLKAKFRADAALARGAPPENEASLAILSSLTFQAGGTYLCTFQGNRNDSNSDQVIANGVTIASGATFTVHAKAGRLSVGTSFTISNTAATLIVGTFANLPDHSVVVIGANHFQVNYEGGDGNDLTLTVLP